MPPRDTPSRGSKPDKLMRDALILALNREAQSADGEPTKKLNKIAEKLVEKAIEGDIQAIKEVNDRVDGKAPMTIGGDPDSPLTVINEIMMRPVPAKHDADN